MALAVAAALMVGAVLIGNPTIDPRQVVLGPPGLNTLAPAYLAPAAVLVVMDRARLLSRLSRPLRGAGLTSGAGLAALWAVLAIRHAWRGADGLAEPGVGDGELYSYTLALLALGSVLMGRAAATGSVRLRWAANAVLMAAIAKVFLVDVAGLEGLARSGSFLALGLCLAGLAWLNRTLAPGIRS
jgi:uncharacterized membrane protein